MRNPLLGGLLAVSLLAPIAVHAQATSSIAPSPAVKTDQLLVLHPAQLAAIGAGVVVGVVVGEVLFSTDLGLIAGGVVGAYFGNLWFTGREVEITTGAMPKT